MSGTTNSLLGVAGLSPSTCVAVGGILGTPNNGTILRSTDGGRTWRSQPSGTTIDLWGVACRGPRICLALGRGDRGTSLMATNGGRTWSGQFSNTGDTLADVAWLAAEEGEPSPTARQVRDRIAAERGARRARAGRSAGKGCGYTGRGSQINCRLIMSCYGGRWSVDRGPRDGTDRMGLEGSVRAATLLVVVRLWSEDGTGLMLRGEVEHVGTGEQRFFGTYGLLVDVIQQWRLDGADAPA